MENPDYYLYLLSLHKDITDSFMQKAVRSVERGEESSRLDPTANKFRKMAWGVLNEIHYLRSFARLNPLGDNVLHGFIKPEHDIGMSVSTYLAKRNPGMVIVVGNYQKSWVSFFDGREVHRSVEGPVSKVLDEFEAKLGSNDTSNVEELWKTYYWSQYCDERRNIRYFSQVMPKKYRKSTALVVEGKSRLASIEKYL